MTVEIPEELKPFITPGRWAKLNFASLDPRHRDQLLGMLRDAFAGETPQSLAPEDVEDVLGEVQQLADDFREILDEGGFDASEIQAGAEASDQVLEDMESGEGEGEE